MVQHLKGAISTGGFYVHKILHPATNFFGEVKEVIQETLSNQGHEVIWSFFDTELDAEGLINRMLLEEPQFAKVLVVHEAKFINRCLEALQRLDAANAAPPRDRVVFRPDRRPVARYYPGAFTQSLIVEWMVFESRLNPCQGATRTFVSRHRRTLAEAGAMASYSLVLLPRLLEAKGDSDTPTAESADSLRTALRALELVMDLSQFVGLRAVYVPSSHEGRVTRAWLGQLAADSSTCLAPIYELKASAEGVVSDIVALPAGSLALLLGDKTELLALAAHILRK